jgi:ribosomal protein S18 acetylase RimI-like enzyme
MEIELSFHPYAPQDLEEVLKLWRESFELGVRVKDPHPLEEQRSYFLYRVLLENKVLLAKEKGELRGFIAFSPKRVAQLYIHVDCWGMGIGSSLLNIAKRESGGSLELYTFTKNTQACAFYESQGFKLIKKGFEEDWGLEDALYRWELDQGSHR